MPGNTARESSSLRWALRLAWEVSVTIAWVAFAFVVFAVVVFFLALGSLGGS